MVKLTIQSTKDRSTKIEVNAYLLKKLTSLLPSREFSQDTWPSSLQLNLADPNIHKPGSVDVLLGADVHAHIILKGLHKHKSLIALNSHLGWLISGGVVQSDTTTHVHNMVVAHKNFESDQLLKRFWEIEENLTNKNPITDLEKQCEEHYKSTHKRNEDGRYVVLLPFRDFPPTNLGNSKSLAVKRLLQMDKRFLRDPEFETAYHKFMEEYESLGHLMKAPKKEKKQTQTLYYLPYYAIQRPLSSTTKFRIVFDGTAESETDNSLKELLIGFPLQQDITDLFIRRRRHKLCLVADIQKMYRPCYRKMSLTTKESYDDTHLHNQLTNIDYSP